MQGRQIGLCRLREASLALPLTIGMSSPGKSYLLQEFANFHFDQFEQFGVVHHVTFVQEDDDVRYTNLTRQQDVFARLRHRAVSSGTTRMAPSIWAAPVIMFLT